MSDPNSDTLDRLRRMTTSEISDALDRLGIEGQALGISGTYGTERVVGPAFTASYLPKGETDGTVGDFIDDVEPGHVVVIDNRGRLDCTVWGNIMCEVGKRRGIGGVVIDGICRDVDLAREIGFPVYARNAAMRTGKEPRRPRSGRGSGRDRHDPRRPRRHRGCRCGRGGLHPRRVSSKRSCCSPIVRSSCTFSQSIIASRSRTLLPGPSWLTSQPT